ncbi:MAG TPA: 8-amino-7-oxononanoate synthase [Polyangiaceae bacterium]|nr:8-amino-7-oxononanoate synthase [Polyangiaceae bacterium]
MKHKTPAALRFLESALEEAARCGLVRERPTVPSKQALLSFCSNDYLDLARRPSPPRASGAGASRLVGGERFEHVELERASAALVDLPSALAFTSGYAANVGLLSALAGPGDLLISDELNHASLIDGARLSRARVVVVPHLRLSAVEDVLRGRGRGNAFVVTESYFSMDADGPDLRALRELCDRFGAALVVDEAHALGVLGPGGRGRCREAGVRPDALVGTYGKAFGASGAFVAGCDTLVRWLWNRARSFVFSTGMAPSQAAAATAGIAAAEQEAGRRERVLAAASAFRRGLQNLGVSPPGFGHIVPWVLGDAGGAVAKAAELVALGIDVRAIRPPSVPRGTARLRFTMTAAHCPADITRALSAVASLVDRSAISCPPP